MKEDQYQSKLPFGWLSEALHQGSKNIIVPRNQYETKGNKEKASFTGISGSRILAAGEFPHILLIKFVHLSLGFFLIFQSLYPGLQVQQILNFF